MIAGHLHTPDPLLAAEQYCGLLAGPLDRRAALGTREVPDDELRTIADAAAHTFLRAFTSTGDHRRPGAQDQPWRDTGTSWTGWASAGRTGGRTTAMTRVPGPSHGS